MCELRKEKGRIIFLGSILLDQASKALANNLKLSLINKGISLGIWSNCYVVILLPILSLGFLVILWHFKKIWNVGLILITAGGTSNCLDRVFYGGVVDFVRLPLIPIFNLADFLVLTGAVFALVDFIKLKKV